MTLLCLSWPVRCVRLCHHFQKCPFEAITIINLPSNLEKDTTHRYSANSFKLHRLPTPRPGIVLGLVGTNGIGKSTALKILAGKQKPNLGKFSVGGFVMNATSLSSSLFTIHACTEPPRLEFTIHNSRLYRAPQTGTKYSHTSEGLNFKITSPKSWRMT